MTTKLPVCWFKSPPPGNLGDVWTPYVFGQMGIDVEWIHAGVSGKMLATGSIARFARAGDAIWGSGIIDSSDILTDRARYICVRGPLTGKKCGCEVYGDPGLLAPIFIDRKAKRQQQTTLIPHYVHLEIAPDDMDKISPITSDVEKTVSEISGCQSVISSSLHGIIFAHAYGIPAGWWRPDDQLTGNDVKFRDYAQSVGIELIAQKEISKVRLVVPSPEAVRKCQQNLIESINQWMHR